MSPEKFSKQQINFMKQALALAEANRNLTGWDPAVGCVLVKGNRVVAAGSHREVATPHAEVAALAKAGPAACGADLYINLEPCAHWGNNPPCVEKIIGAGVKKVFAAVGDPNPLVNGRGFKKLKEAGVEVEVGLLQDEALKLNESFFKFIRKKIPFVTLKIAQSLDGKIATVSGQSQWLTGRPSRKKTHYLRSLNQAIMVGTETILKDNPSLTVRLVKAKYQPLRVVLDAFGKIPFSARVFDKKAPTLLIVSKKFSRSRAKQLTRRGITVLTLPAKNGLFDLKTILKILGRKKIASLMVEGGAEILGAFIKNNLADKIVIFIAPIIIGGRQSIPAVGGSDLKKLAQAYQLNNLTVQKSGRDLMVTGYF